MDFELPEEIKALQLNVRRLCKSVIKDRARSIDRDGTYPQDMLDLFKQSSLLGLCIPEKYGGSEAGILGLSVAIEEVAKYSNTLALMLLLTRLPTGPILIGGNEAQKQKYLPGIATGEQRAAFGLSEFGAGSDVAGMATTFKAEGDKYIINGSKCWMSGIKQADWYIIFAKEGDAKSRDHNRIKAFIVDRNSEGLSIGRIDKKMGVKGIDTGELILDNVEVSPENVLEEVPGFKLAMLSLNSMRPIVAARGIGLAEGALMYGVSYMKERKAFGKNLSDFQALQFKVAELAVKIEAARLLTYRAALLSDANKFTNEYVPYLSMCKYYASELAVETSNVALQLLGAAGYMEDHLTELYYRDAKQLTIVEGTSEIQLGLIAKGLLNETLWWD